MQANLLHHGSDTYEVASAKAVDWAKDKLNALISRGRENIKETLDYIDTHQPTDAIVPNSRFYFGVDDRKITLEVPGLGKSSVHPHALDQIVGKLGGTKKVTDFGSDPDVVHFFADMLEAKMAAQTGKKYLVRTVDNQVRGVMSDRYRRLDNRPMVQALLEEAVGKHGALPLDAKILDTSFSFKVILPQIYQPVPDEVGVFGLCFRNSDFGAGRLYLKGFFNRLWCTNLAMTEDGLSQVHLGRRLSEDIEFSQRTYDLDTMTMASSIKDVVAHVLGKDNIEKRMELIKEASQEDPNFKANEAIKALVKGNKLSKAEGEKAKEHFSSAEVKLLPPGQSKWRLSNVFSLMAQESDADRQLELENLAGSTAGLHV